MKRTICIVVLLITTFFLSDNLSAQTDQKEEIITPVATTDYSHPFVRMLEDVELKYYENKKHWRKGDYPPYEFIRCDIDQDRARLSYKKEGNRLEFYLVYFERFNGEWHFEFNDVAFQTKIQKDGSKTTLEDVLNTKNEMYWFSKDKIDIENNF